MKPAEHLPIEIVVEPWFADHRFMGRIVFPAVETMLLLADWAHRLRPGTDVRIMEHALFTRFLDIPADRTVLPAAITLADETDGSVTATLHSKIMLRTCSRWQTHGSLRFPPAAHAGTGEQKAAADIQETTRSVDADLIYRELVPFGPGYRSLQGELLLAATAARGVVRAPVHQPSDRRAYGQLGSPFPLDGAFHAACVCGQQQTSFIPFPVGFSRRVINRLTEPGQDYLVGVELERITNEELCCDVWISTEDGDLCEAVSGLRMRDVSGGRLRPPAWINCGPSPRPATAPSRPGSTSET